MADPPPFRSAFSDVDASGAGHRLIDYLDAARRAPAIVEAKSWSVDLSESSPSTSAAISSPLSADDYAAS